jgi:ethanolamine utilization protein EutN
VKIGRITGTVVSTRKEESLEGIKLLLVQPVDDKMQNSGEPLVACDTVQAGTGDLVIYEGGREAALALDNWYNPADAAVIGIIDQLDQVGK